jgi:hypothetical protein
MKGGIEDRSGLLLEKRIPSPKSEEGCKSTIKKDTFLIK